MANHYFASLIKTLIISIAESLPQVSRWVPQYCVFQLGSLCSMQGVKSERFKGHKAQISAGHLLLTMCGCMWRSTCQCHSAGKEGVHICVYLRMQKCACTVCALDLKMWRYGAAAIFVNTHLWVIEGNTRQLVMRLF